MTDHTTYVRERSWAFDIGLCAGVGMITVVPWVLFGGRSFSGLALDCMLVLPLIIRRTMPLLALIAMSFAAVLMVMAQNQPAMSIIAVPILVYSLARWQSSSLSRAAVLAGMFGSFIGPARWTLARGGETGALVMFGISVAACAGAVSAAYLVGRRRREMQESVAQRQRSELERERLLVAEQTQRARMATVEERNRIARELHDIVAHSLSVIVVQAEGAKAIAAKRPERAVEVLGTIAETSREALEEMRRMVGLLRSSGPEPERAAYVPMPGLTDIPDLVRKTSDRARLQVCGEPPRVSQALGLTAYRIVQESLTNVLKHAGPHAFAEVNLGYSPGSIEIEIADDGSGAAASSDGRGHGLQGMHERVAIHGGTLHAHARPGGGFVVRASLPVVGEPADTGSFGPVSWPVLGGGSPPSTGQPQPPTAHVPAGLSLPPSLEQPFGPGPAGGHRR